LIKKYLDGHVVSTGKEISKGAKRIFKKVFTTKPAVNTDKEKLLKLFKGLK
jgi:hypothetical protein